MNMHKIAIFVFVTVLLFYMINLALFTKRKWQFRTHTFITLFGGLLLLNIATFFDAFNYKMNYKYSPIIVRICFTIGGLIYVIGTILWSNYTKSVIEKFERLSLTDSMTGVLNRSGIEKMYDMIAKEGKFFYVILCDLDGMKRINDNYGHQKGDKYINDTIDILTNLIGLRGHVARIGGDEFVILLEHIAIKDLNQLIFNIKLRVSEILPNQNTGVSIGFSLFPNDGSEFDSLIKLADSKMYEDKKKRKSYR